MTLKVFVNYILVKIRIRHILPNYFIKRVKVNDCKEQLVRIDTNPQITFDDRMHKPVYLRETVYKKIKLLIDDVEKDGYSIKLYDAYRSFDDQMNSWNKRIEETKKEFPNCSEDEIIRKTSLKVSNVQDKENVGGHQTGGAIDITLIKDGKEIDMGTKYEEYSQKTLTHNKLINETQKSNRFYLKKKLEKYDFNNFPAEWWHYSYGDKMWAAYKGKKTCIYGYIEPNDIKKE